MRASELFIEYQVRHQVLRFSDAIGRVTLAAATGGKAGLFPPVSTVAAHHLALSRHICYPSHQAHVHHTSWSYVGACYPAIVPIVLESEC
jgi:hypothetical protein